MRKERPHPLEEKRKQTAKAIKAVQSHRLRLTRPQRISSGVGRGAIRGPGFYLGHPFAAAAEARVYIANGGGMNRQRSRKCEVCGLQAPYLTRHHLCPQTRRGASKRGPIARVCEPCHIQIHRLFENKFLRDELNTLEALKADPAVKKWVSWRRNGAGAA